LAIKNKSITMHSNMNVKLPNFMFQKIYHFSWPILIYWYLIVGPATMGQYLEQTSAF